MLHRARRQWQQQWRPKQTVEEQNIWDLYLEIAWFGVLSGLATAFTHVFAVRLSASNMVVGLLTSLPALINVLCLLPAARIIEGQRRLMPIIVLTSSLHRFGYLLIALMPLVVRPHRPEALVLLVALLTIPAGAANVAFTSMLADVVSPRDRARVVSIRNILAGISSAMAVLVGGKLLDLIPFPPNYQFIFFIGFLASLVSLRYLRHIQAPDIMVEQRTRASGLPIVRLRRFMREVIGQHDFVRFVFSAFIFHWGLYLPMALYPIYRVRELEASDSWIGLLAMAQSATTVFTYFLWGKVAERRGNRPVLWISSLGMVLFPMLTGLSPRVEPLLLVSIIGGIFGAGFNLSLFNTILEVCPQERRPSYVAFHTTLVNVAAFLAPLLGVSLANALNIRTALFIAGLGRLLGALLFYALLVKWPKTDFSGKM